MLHRLKAICTALMICSTLSAPVAAEPVLKTLRTADENRGWEAVGRLNFGQQGFCTASLITADIVITAAHCLFNKDTGERIPVERIEFQAGLRFGRAEAYRGIRRVVLHPNYDYFRADGLDRVGSDLAILELDRPIRNGYVRPFRTEQNIAMGQTVQVVSYARERSDAPSRQDSCDVLTRDHAILVLSCAVDFGASGSPVFSIIDGEPRIVSIISAKAEWQGQPVALAAAMEGELDVLISELARTPALRPVGKTVRVNDPVETNSN
ncbi:MAG: S1 family peptidase [Pseudomonadota bacterium]